MNDKTIKERRAEWHQRHHAPFDIEKHKTELLALFDVVRSEANFSPTKLNLLIVRHIHENGETVPQDRVLQAYREMTSRGIVPFEQHVFDRLRLRPMRTISGVAPVAVLTAAYPCPGECIFCPDAQGFPKSYLPLEPGVQRASENNFDPFKQVESRLRTYYSNGHPTDKIELLILGGTWSAYPHKYQERFIQRCLDAMNGVDSESLADAQHINETAEHRNVGLVIETRPDHITIDEVRRLRSLGVTKVQMGAQSLDDTILALNKRGHTVEDTRRAMRLLRLGGFKIHLHWMPNLFGATPESDRKDFEQLWNDPGIRPDELKLYPCSLIEGTELYTRWQNGEYRAYTDEELVSLLADCKATVPQYCRINRVFRDIPASYIVTGSKTSHLRLVVQKEMKQRGTQCQCIRCREVRNEKPDTESLRLDDLVYETDATTEHFVSFVTPYNKLAGFMRLSLPSPNAPQDEILQEIRHHAMIREVHVYGRALEIGADSHGEAQHTGLGTRLIERAMQIARDASFKRIAVISAIGTREYYRKLGFELGELYMARSLE
jgi:elongator complex protein 3